MDASEKGAVRQHVLAALCEKQGSSFSFLGHLLALQWSDIQADSLVVTMPVGPHCTDAAGRVSMSALCGMVDIGLANACRLAVGRGWRLATIQLHLQLTGVALEGDLILSAAFDGFSTGTALRQLFSHGVVTCGGKAVCHARASFVALPPPSKTRLDAYPWEQMKSHGASGLKATELDADAQALLADCERALACTNNDRGFLDRFLGLAPRANESGSLCEIAITPTLSNRVGHVQGGLLLSIAAQTAQAAAGDHPVLSSLSCSYTGPGRGDRLSARSDVLHRGRSFATIQTQVRTSDSVLVSDTISTHAAGRT
ncbi:acyl-CoA thioesterase domain-containing protein [Paracoccus aerius]|uniref:Thioesterase family protein n=1 Tax=Paracoccus aerius TaxID=1915382 RepID=A0ABS1SA10_9RHOB|nr:acyl-CoA thioesterase domain-containing protein [Paracoccus aerius]MBL3675548.1 thioesterase family protein [Paracoccus aerius]